MPKKKALKLRANQDFTINDSANAPKPVRRVKKSTATEPPLELTWDQLTEDDIDLVEEIDADGIKKIVTRKKKKHSKSQDLFEDRSGIVYPEILFYHLSKYIYPETIKTFALLCKSCYALTKRELFWRQLYMDYCDDVSWIPRDLSLENNSKQYGLRQRVIRALYHSYYPFMKLIMTTPLELGSEPHKLVKRCCVSVWYRKKQTSWAVYFKLKRINLDQRAECSTGSFLEELSRIDANPEEDIQVLQVSCRTVYEVPPLMGMTLSSVNVSLSQGFTSQRLRLGFNQGIHNVSRDILPEISVVLDNIRSIQVFNWWHPRYPHFDNSIKLNLTEEETGLPVLKKDFFS